MLSFEIVIGFFVLITGLCIGSFLNVVILRALSNESIVFPASKCPICQTPLKWWHNIPVFSYIFLRGKCAFCHKHISIQYPIIELLTGYLFLMIFLKFGLNFNSLFLMLFICMFIVIATTDIKEHVSFDVHCYILMGLGLVYNFFNFGNIYSGHTWIFNTSFVASIIGLVIGACIIGLYLGIGYLIFKCMIIGPGDIYIAGALGACFGYKYILPILIISIVLQVLFALPAFFKKACKNKAYPMIIAAILFTTFTTLDLIYLKYFNLGIIAINLFFYVLILISGLYLSKKIIESLPKNLNEISAEDIADNKTEAFSMPFGPALTMASIIFIFFFLS